MQHARSADNPKGPVVWPARCLQNFPSAASVLPPDSSRAHSPNQLSRLETSMKDPSLSELPPPAGGDNARGACGTKKGKASNKFSLSHTA